MTHTAKLGVALTVCALMMGCQTTSSWRGAPKVSGEALCDGLEPLVRAHASGLVADGGPMAQGTGRDLIESLDAGCASP